MTIMTEKIDQARARTCDAKCYGSRRPRGKCRCICGGHNHGHGLQHAIDNIRRFFKPQLASRPRLKFSTFTKDMLSQKRLFDDDQITKIAQGTLF
jgi:hypothetical protein